MWRSIASAFFTFAMCGTASAQRSCPSVFESKRFDGATFLHAKDPNLHLTPVVALTAIHARVNKSRPTPKIDAWLQHLEKSAQKLRDNLRDGERARKSLHAKHLTKAENVPDSFFRAQARIARELGFGNVEFTDDIRTAIADVMHKDQLESLDKWIDYLLLENTPYPMWAKYWAFSSVVTLGIYNADTGQFAERSRGQMAPFPELNRAALALVLESTSEKLNGASLNEIRTFVTTTASNFGFNYGQVVRQLSREQAIDLSSTRGKWVTYPAKSDAAPLVNSIAGWMTNWCTRGTATATSQLESGDFHVLYTEDIAGVVRVPRVAIRMEGPRIAEIRGVGPEQNLDRQIAHAPLLKDKLLEFGKEGELYYKKVGDMKRLSLLEKKQLKQENFSIEDLRFLYEMDQRIVGFGYGADPRVGEIRAARNTKQDLVAILNLKESEISLTTEEALSGGIKYHHGDLYLDAEQTRRTLIPAVKLLGRRLVVGRLPETVSGTLSLQGLKTTDEVVLPRTKIGGNLEMIGISQSEADKLPKPRDFKGKVKIKHSGLIIRI